MILALFLLNGGQDSSKPVLTQAHSMLRVRCRDCDGVWSVLELA